MAFNIFATATSDIPLANLDANFTMIGSSAVASTLYPTATTSITYGTAGTSHIFSGSIGAFTLGGTVAGGGNQLNNVVIGTSNPLAGAFTTLSATGLISAPAGVEIGSTAIANQTVKLWRGTAGEYGTVGVTGNGLNLNAQQGYVNLQLAGVDKVVLSSTGLAVTGTLTTTGTINLLTVGRGGGAVSTNTAVGASALAAVTSSAANAAFGYQALLTTITGDENSAFGYQALKLNTGKDNSAFGVVALATNSSGNYNTALGAYALNANTTASNNTAVGYQAGYAITASNNTFIGYKAGYLATTGGDNTIIGVSTPSGLTTGSNNVGLGGLSTYYTFNLTTESNRLIVGHSLISNAYVQVAWTVVSDARDKTDVATTPYGLDFVNELKPIQYCWDKRSHYDNGQPDGSKKEDKLQLGFLAQDVIALEKKYGATEKDLLIADDEQDDSLKITETKMIPVLVKAIQEQQVIITALTTRITALENK
jgi:hypothetical protein